ncbi:PEP-CTERM sorting domain-containing protein [Aquabacterium sp.]|uniref:PEP-CTERM sorting domain-containing protein n=1 Tax=Aquabacterium sp. TaxID=1872578 RepID=UPI003784401F
MKRILFLLLNWLLAGLACAVPTTLHFHADGFENAGTQYPGFSGPIDGSISWNGSGNAYDPIGALTAIDLTIAGHQYGLNEIGIANQGSTQTALGGLFRGANAVVGDGAGDDFLLVFDRVNPLINAFAFSIAGKTNAIWWSPTTTSATIDVNNVPEPGSLLLVAAAIGGLMLAARRRKLQPNDDTTRSPSPFGAPGVPTHA